VAGGAARCPVCGDIAFVVRQPEDERQQDLLMYDLGQATASIMLAAADLGIGSGHAAVSDQEQAQRVLEFPDGYFCAYLIGLGYPADRRLQPLVRPNRRPLDEVVHWDRW
jgi:nitroreductase